MKVAKCHFVPIRTVHSGTDLRGIAKKAGQWSRKKDGKIPFRREHVGKASDDLDSDVGSEISETWTETRRSMMKFEAQGHG